ncbi:MAG: heme-binding domain-containing protein [Bryobacteraceae bacterium]
MRRILVVSVLAMCVGAALLLVVSRQPESAAKPAAGVSDDPAVAAILARSCEDCHSDRTRWPWYGHVWPVCWLLNHDVKEARSHMDFSQWSKYSPDDKRQILTEVAAEVRNNRMPPFRYLLMHRGARLSADETARIYAWTRNERRKLRAEAAGGAGDPR